MEKYNYNKKIKNHLFKTINYKIKKSFKQFLNKEIKIIKQKSYWLMIDYLSLTLKLKKLYLTTI
jgi:hypothetical protein